MNDVARSADECNSFVGDGPTYSCLLCGRLGTEHASLKDALKEREAVEQMVANGELCSKDGEPCEFERVNEKYGEDADGNRGVWVHYYACRKCGEER